jgi:hypothetical protein
MVRFAVWFTRNADAVVTLVLALFVGLISLGFTLNQQVVYGAILLTLGLLATSILRDRYRRAPVEEEVRDGLQATAEILTGLPERLRRIDRLEDLVAAQRQALDDMSMVRVLSGANVGQVLAEARRGTDRWIFKGGTGTFLRAVTLPECVAAARREKRTLLVRLEIVDPTNEEVCDRYARFRRSVSNGPDGIGEVWTLDRTRKEAFATILAACWYRERFGLLDIDIGLSTVMTTFRWDLSAHCVLITQDDPRAQALMFEHGRVFYDHWSIWLLTSLEQARRVPIEQARSVPLSDEPTVEEVRKVFDVLGLALPRSFSDRDVVDVAMKALRAKNPYE